MQISESNTKVTTIAKKGSLCCFLVLALILTWNKSLDQAAQDYLADALADSLVVYASARTINGLISVIQSVEIGVSVGAGVAVNFGEILDPLNDLIERFSGFVLYALVGLGLQQLALTASASLVTKAIVSAALITAGWAWLKAWSMPNWLQRLVVLLFILRFAFVAQVGLTWVLDKAYFDRHQAEAVSTLDLAKNQLREIRDTYTQALERKGFFSGFMDTARSLLGSETEQGITDLAATAIISLIAIMLIKSVLLPGVFILILLAIIRHTLKPAWA